MENSAIQPSKICDPGARHADDIERSLLDDACSLLDGGRALLRSCLLVSLTIQERLAMGSYFHV
jgi:hypothetical protein